MSEPPRHAKFCPNCGAALPPGAARFCIQCGRALPGADPPTPPPEPPAAAPAARAGRRPAAPTVQLANARGAQEVIGGTVKLPSSGAVPPGLWVVDYPPGPTDVVAIYPPLRPVRAGWSGQIGRGWRAAGSEEQGKRTRFRFRTIVTWFPADGCGADMQLRAEVEATSFAWDGKNRRGFRFGLGRDGPMQIVHASWYDAAGQAQPAQALPQIQIMAPPRVARVSDLDEEPALLDAREATLWAANSQVSGAYRLFYEELRQEHTPVGRGITLIPLREGREHGQPWWGRLLPGVLPARFRILLTRPFRCDLTAWDERLSAIRAEAHGLGLDLEPALAAEWWLDRQGYDGVCFSGAKERYDAEQVVIVFRRGQLARIRD